MNYEQTPVAVLFVVTVLSYFGVCFSKAYFSKQITSNTKDYNLFNFIVSVICAFVIFCLGNFDTKISFYTFTLALIFGIITMIYSILYSIAVNIGTFSYTTIINSSSTMITALSGYFFWGESLTIAKIVGVIMMFVCYMLSNSKDECKEKLNAKWFVVCIFMALTLSVLGLCQKTHQESLYKQEYTMFLVVSFMVSAIVSFVMYFVDSHNVGFYGFENKNAMPKKKFVITIVSIFIVNAVFLGFNNGINLYLTGVVDSAVFFPITSGASIMLNLLASLIFFKEKLSVRQWIGLAFGVASVMLLCI